MTQKERQERSRKEIYQAALEEFGTYGYDKVQHGADLWEPRDLQGHDVPLLLQ